MSRGSAYLVIPVFFILICSLLFKGEIFSLNNSAIINNSSFLNDSTILPGYINCLLQYTTKECDDCPPNCITFKSNNFIIKNKELADKIDQVFEKSLRQISILNAGMNQNDTNTAQVYLQSMLLKHHLKISEVYLISDLIKKIRNANSTIIMGKDIHEKLNILTEDKTATPLALSILKITLKSTDLLINSDSIVFDIQNYPNLSHDLSEQKKWLLKILSNTIVGCEISGVLGCLMSSITTAGL